MLPNVFRENNSGFEFESGIEVSKSSHCARRLVDE